MVDMTRAKADLVNMKTEEKLDYFNKIVEQMDRDDYNNERKHNYHRDCFDISVLDRGTDEENTYIPSEITKLYQYQTLEDYIFSKRYDDLHQLLRYEVISKAVIDIPDNRKEILFLKVILGYTEKEISEGKCVSQSNISQLYKKAVDYIRIRLLCHIRGKTISNHPLLKHEKEFLNKFKDKYIDKMN